MNAERATPGSRRVAQFARLQDAIDSSVAARLTLGLLVVRVRRLRNTSHLLGYDTGEALVEAIHALLEGGLREGDALWRTGEDEFAVCLPDLHDRNHAALAASKFSRLLSAPLRVAGHSVMPVVSIGVATAPEDTRDAHALYRYADIASDHASPGEERHAFYAAPANAPLFDAGELGEALAGNQLQLHLQRILSLGQAGPERYEALARWQHPRLGAIRPDVFVRVAEQAGLIGDLTRWSLSVGLRHASESAARGAPFSISVNIAVDALRLPGFTEQVTDLLAFWNVPPERLVLEVTESALMTDAVGSARILGRLRDAGVGVAIDDFGTGYSSMAYLRRLPANELKIDRSFVSDMLADVRARKLVGSMIDVSHHLDMTAVAEGVEDADTLALLRAMGCDHAQGFHIARPAPPHLAITGGDA